MILEYHRPESLAVALALLARTEPVTVPMGGGSVLNRPSTSPLAVVDLQALGLNTLHRRGNKLDIGATLTLQTLLTWGRGEQVTSPEQLLLYKSLQVVIEREATYNLRQVATVAGTLVAADGRSSFTVAMLALDATMTLLSGGEAISSDVSLGDLLPLRAELLRGRLISQVSLSLNSRLAFHAIARTPADWPIVCAAMATWPSGRTRLVLGGYGAMPILVLDGTVADSAQLAAESAYSTAGDEWASAEYRLAAAGTLVQRCLADLELV